MSTILSDWLKALNNLQASVSKDLEEIRKQKAEIQQIKINVFDRVAPGKYFRDDQRIVISAPEIIIGNVDASGLQWGDSGSSIVIRGNQVNLDGVGSSGVIKSRASHIEQIAVDPGPDGLENVVQPQSSIISQAKNIVIQSNESQGCFSQVPYGTAGTGIRIHADENLQIEATQSVKLHGDEISNRLKSLKETKSSLSTDTTKQIADVSSLIAKVEKVLNAQDGLNDTIEDVAFNVVELSELQDEFEQLIPTLYQAMDSCIHSLSLLAETNRSITALEDEQKQVKDKSSKFLDEPTGAQLTVNAEYIGVASVDGDGNIRTNPEASINMQTGSVNISTKKADGSFIDNSHVSIDSHDVSISTVSAKLQDPHGVNGEYTADGHVDIMSKNVSVMAVDYTLDDNGYTEKQLSKDSSLRVRMENVGVYATDPEGQAIGSFGVHAKNMDLESSDKEGTATGRIQLLAKDTVLSSADKDGNAIGTLNLRAQDIAVASVDKSGKALGQVGINGKNVFIKAMDTDEKGADKSLAAGGSMTLVAEQMFVGRSDKDNLSKQLQLSADKTGLYGKTTTEVQQGEAKAVVQLDGGNVAVSGAKAAFYGDSTVNGKTTFNADATMTKLTADHLEAKTSFKSKNISDGIAVPGAPSSAKLSAKLSEADAPKAKAVELPADEEEQKQ